MTHSPHAATGAPGPDQDNVGVTRRGFLTSMGAAGATAGAAHLAGPAHAAPPARLDDSAAIKSGLPKPVAGEMRVKLLVNGATHELNLDPRTTLLDALRESLQLTGTKKGCDHGQCGACTVHVNGRRVNSCLSLAATQEGDEITTIEGLGQPGKLHPMQQAFVDHDGYQCGYCTSGQIMSGVALMQEPCGQSDADVQEAMSGNICRCGAYSNIVTAIQFVRKA